MRSSRSCEPPSAVTWPSRVDTSGVAAKRCRFSSWGGPLERVQRCVPKRRGPGRHIQELATGVPRQVDRKTRSRNATAPEATDDRPSGVDVVTKMMDDDTYWRAMREQAESGRDPRAIRELVDAALWALESGQPMNEQVRAFTIRSLRDLRGGVPRIEEFAPSHSWHRRSGRVAARNTALAAAMIVQMRRKPSLTRTAAARIVIDTVGDQWGVDPAAIDGRFVKDPTKVIIRAFERFREALERFDTDTLEQLSLSGPPG